MKTFIFLISLVSSAISLAGDNVDETLTVAEGGTVEVDVVRGDVSIFTWDKLEVRVRGELDDATKKFVFETSGNKTIIKVKVDDGFFDKKWNSQNSELNIYIPINSDLEAEGVSTDFNVEGVKGSVVVHSVSGDLRLEELENSINAEAVSGDVTITQSKGKMKLETVSGDIDVSGEAFHFDATTVSGDIEAIIGLAEIVDLSSVSGDLEVDFELAKDGRVEAQTVSGNIELNFNNDKINARFDLETGPGGDIDNDITNDRADKSFVGSEEVSFKIGSGAGSIDAETMSGTIKVRN